MTVFEIEDYGGNTIMAFRVKQNVKIEDIMELSDCSVADMESDYLLNTDDMLIRIQSDIE